MKSLKDRINETLGREQRLKYQRVRNQGCRARKEYARTEKASELKVPVVEKLSKQDREDQHDRDLNDQI
jgi:hypothetical protein